MPGVVDQNVADHRVVGAAGDTRRNDQIDAGSVDQSTDDHALQRRWLSTEDHVDRIASAAGLEFDVR